MFTMLDVGNFFLFISGFLMIHTAYKDRKVLSGYNFTGSLMLAIGISFVIIFYLQEAKGYTIASAGSAMAAYPIIGFMPAFFAAL